LILDLPIEISQERLKKAGKSLEEKYHTHTDLEHYRARFLDVAQKLERAHLIDANTTQAEVLGRALRALV
jgi:thymidylate kinase